MKKVKVIDDKCIGCGACIAIDSEHFDFDPEKGISMVISEANIEESEAVKEAVDACPVGAIEYFEGCANDKCQCDPCNCGDDCKCDGTCQCSNCK